MLQQFHRAIKNLTSLCPLAAVLIASGNLLAADQSLLDFGSPSLGKSFATNDARFVRMQTDGSPRIRITTGHSTSWPGITLRPESGPWDLSGKGQVTLRVRNIGSNQVTVSCRVDNPGADGASHCVTGSTTLPPSQSETLRVPLNAAGNDTLGGKLFGMRGYPVSASGKGAIDPGNITQILIFVSQPKTEHVFEIWDLTASGSWQPPTAWTTDATPYFPLIDTFGQYRHKNWPGKTLSRTDLESKRTAEAQELETKKSPTNWCRYGGWVTGPQLTATGFFRTEKYHGKWWLVDPEGHLFFSHGLDCVRMFDTTPITERETWFEEFPGKDRAFAEFLSQGYALKGHYEGRTMQCFSFFGANLLRKYGPDWRATYPALIHKRLRSWGLNTIANWSDQGTFLMRLTPYTDAVGSGRTKLIEGSEGYWGKFPDVFDPSFHESLRSGMESKKGKSANDPWCIGYFSDNEMSWGDEVSLAIATLKSPPEQAAKKVFIADLRKKYPEIAGLNAAWGSHHESWQALASSREAPNVEKARADLAAFYTRLAEEYFHGVRNAIKSVAPNQLYLGCRFAWVNDRAAMASAKYCDVVSYNLYQRSVAEFKFNGRADVPLIIGEFHFGALDRGMFHTGLVPVETQQARAAAYKDYVRGALKHPQFVGCHWFQYADEPTTGRVYDEENYQIGFVDIADTPYAETVQACREVGKELYPAAQPTGSGR